MNLGNTSQSNVPVPNFFLNKELKQMETFQVSKSKKYFREKDLFRNTKDINFCNNPRNFNRKHENFNKTKYSPDLTNLNSFLKTGSKSNNKKSHFPTENPKPDTYDNFRNFMQRTNITNYTNPELRDEIKTNINVLLDKINYKYDLEKWAHTDTRTNFINTKSNNLNINNGLNTNEFDSLMSNFNSTKSERNFNETDATKFKTILRDKINGMSIDRNYKSKLVSNIDLYNNSTSDKFYKTKTSNIISTYAANEAMPTQRSIGDTDETRFDEDMNTIQNFKTNYKNIETKNEININDNFNITKICLPTVMNKYSTISDNMYKNQIEVDRLKKDNNQKNKK